MGIRFRNSIRLAPGIRLNLGKTSVSLSAGVRGASVTLGENGLWGNAGIPGTGLSYRTQLNNSSSQRKRAQQTRYRHQRDEELQTFRQERQATLLMRLDDRGQLLLEKEAGQSLNAQEKKWVWNQYGEELVRWLEKQRDEINGEMELILNIHADIQPPGSGIPQYEPVPFVEEEPQEPTAKPHPVKPEKPQLNLEFWDKLIPGRTEKKRLAYNAAVAVWENTVKQWQQACQIQDNQTRQVINDHQQHRQVWCENKARHESEQQLIRQQFQQRLSTDEALMTEVLTAELEGLD